MGNQQSKKQEAQVQPTKEVEVELKQITPKQDSFVLQIQNQNQRNVNQRKSISTVPDLNVVTTTPTNPVPRLSKKQPSKKELPPLKLKNDTSMKSTPLRNCQNFTNQANNGVEELEEVQCQKDQKNTGKNDSAVGEMDDKESECQKQNNEAAMNNVRAKKFRPSQSSTKKIIASSNAFVNEARQATQFDQVTAI